MALDKAIQSGKEKRRPYRGGKAVSHGCRNHGSCSYCRGNRTIRNKRLAEKAKDALKLKTAFLSLFLILITVPVFAQDRPTRESEAIDRLSDQITGILCRQRATEYRLAEDGALIVNGERWVLNWEGISKETKKRAIKTNGLPTAGGKGKK